MAAVAPNAPVTSKGAVPGTTWARARLRLGIASVGTLVVGSIALLATRVPERQLPASTAWAAGDILWLGLLVAAYVVVSAPFDLVGGLILPRRFHRMGVEPAHWVRLWLRGVLVHGACLLVTALALLAAGRAGGEAAAVGVVLAVMAVLLAAQVYVADLVGGVHRKEDRLRAGDASFVGGIAGVPGFDRVWLSDAWDDRIARVQRFRRDAVRRSGSRALGVIIALVFDLAGLVLALVATSASTTSVAGVATLSLWATIWSFLGLLVLPSLSRGAVIAAGSAAVRQGCASAEVEHALRALDCEQEDEPARRRLVETIFHPVPSLDRRLAALATGTSPPLPRPWNTARTALFLSWASLGLLSRAVHCNCGRPELWALFPGD